MRQPLTPRHTRACLVAMYPLALVGLIWTTSGAGCFGPPPQVDNKPRTAALRAFGSAEELRQLLVEQANARYNDNRGGGGWLLGLPMAAPMASQDSTTNTGGTGGESANGGTPFSSTTIQEAGVDESDIIKNDGDFIYWLQSNKIHVVKATPPDAMSEVATITLDTAASALYLRGRQLVAISPEWTYGIYGDGGGSGTATVAAADAPVQSDAAAVASLTFPNFDSQSCIRGLFCCKF